MPQTAELKRQALGGAAWSVARFGGEQVFRFIVFVFLARLLTPSDFGLFALSLVFVDVGRILAFAGMSEAVIRSEQADDELADTLFWLSLGRTFVVSMALVLLSLPLAAVLKQPMTAPVIMSLAACLMFEPLTQVHSARATRAFKNKALTGIALFCNFASGGAAVVAAMNGLGIWSFVISQVVYGVLVTGLIWSIFPWAPRLSGFSRRRLSEIGRFSGNMVFAQLVYVSVARTQDFVTGRFLGPASLGQLRVAGRVFEVINQALVTPLAAVALPTLSRLQDNDRGFRNAFSRMAALSSVVVCPASLGFAAVAPDALPLLFGPQWVEAIPLVRVIALGAPVAVIGAFAGPTLVALGRSDTMVRFALLQLVTVAAISLSAVQFGLLALAVANVARAYLTMPIQLWMFSKATGMKGWEVTRNVVPPIIGSVIMAGVLMAAAPSIHAWIESPILRLCVMVPMGVMIYGAVLLAGWRSFVLDQVQGVRSALAARGGAGA